MATTTCEPACPIFGPIMDDICAADDFSTLTDIRRRRIPHAKGISDEQRSELLDAVVDREDTLGRLAGI